MVGCSSWTTHPHLPAAANLIIMLPPSAPCNKNVIWPYRPSTVKVLQQTQTMAGKTIGAIELCSPTLTRCMAPALWPVCRQFLIAGWRLQTQLHVLHCDFDINPYQCLSGLFDQEMGVPQGSVLSVTLFALKINSPQFSASHLPHFCGDMNCSIPKVKTMPQMSQTCRHLTLSLITLSIADVS